MEERSNTSVRLDDGKVEELTTGLDRGAGVRVARGTSYGYAFSNRLDRDALLQAAEAASAALTEEAGGHGRRPARVSVTRREPRGSPGLRGGAGPEGRLARRAERRRAQLQPRGRAGRGGLRRFAAAQAHRDLRRALGPGGPPADPAGGPGDRLAGRGQHPDRLRGAGRLRGCRVPGRERPDGSLRRSPRGAPSRCSTRSRPRRERCPWCSARAAAVSSSTRPWAIPWRPTPSTRRRASTAGGSARPWRRRS